MNDLPMLVDYVSSDDASVDDSRDSSTGSYDEELKSIYDDHESGTRWINQFIATPPWTADHNIHSMDALDDFDKSSFPAGSTIDMSCTPSPVDLCDFPYLDMEPPRYARSRPPLAPDMSEGDQVVHLKCIVRTIGLSATSLFPKLFRLHHGEQNDVMADTGANSCMADSELHLVNCRDIKPVRIGLALKSSGPATNYTCSRMGYLPMTR